MVLPASLPCAIVIRRARARFFYDIFGGSRAGEYQACGAPGVVLRGAIVRWGREIEADMEDSGGEEEKSDKGHLEQDGWEQRR